MKSPKYLSAVVDDEGGAMLAITVVPDSIVHVVLTATQRASLIETLSGPHTGVAANWLSKPPSLGVEPMGDD